MKSIKWILAVFIAVLSFHTFASAHIGKSCVHEGMADGMFSHKTKAVVVIAYETAKASKGLQAAAQTFEYATVPFEDGNARIVLCVAKGVNDLEIHFPGAVPLVEPLRGKTHGAIYAQMMDFLERAANGPILWRTAFLPTRNGNLIRVNGESPSVYRHGGQMQDVLIGEVLSVRDVQIAGDTTGKVVGGALGGAAGGVLSHMLTRKSKSGGVWAINSAVAVAMGAGGTKVGEYLSRDAAQEIIVRLESGRTVAITQAKDVVLQVGTKVRVIGVSPARVVQL